MMNHQDIQIIKKMLRYSYLPFFGSYGSFSAVQRETIPKILNDINVVVSSPTASGKTEAVVAPIAEKFKQEGWGGLAILYIVPTRSLANDLLRRIEGPLSDMGIKAVIKHGDKPYLPVKEIPNVVITTPESLDSMICHKAKLLKDVKAIVTDEIHLLDNTYRGDQLRVLIKRIKKNAHNTKIGIHLLSATISSAQKIGQRYLQEFQVISVPGNRDIDLSIVRSCKELYDLVRSRGWKKVLCFCNMRESVETLTDTLTKLWHPYPVLAHHGSLGPQVRKESERIIKEAQVAVCVATSSLEVGIDIGDIDVVVLAEIPWSISSLLQRIGRASRRKSVVQAAAIIKSEEEKLLVEEMFKMAKCGTLPEETYYPDLSVIIQQTFSYLFQNPTGASESELIELFYTLGCEEQIRKILWHLQEKGWIEKSGRNWVASTMLMDLGEKGRIHSNIPDSETYNVIDVNSGRIIGKIMGTFDEVFVLMGKIWKVVSLEKGVIKVTQFSGSALAPVFRRHKSEGAFYWLLPEELKNLKVTAAEEYL